MLRSSAGQEFEQDRVGMFSEDLDGSDDSNA